MSQIISQIKSSSSIWKAYKRFSVGDTCQHNLIVWSNVTGKNSEPNKLNPDWVEVGVSNNLNSLVVGAEVQNLKTTNATNDKEFIIISGTYEGPYPEKVESYSANSIKREI